MVRFTLLLTTLLGIALVISFSANPHIAANQASTELGLLTNARLDKVFETHQDAACFQFTALGATIFSTNELKHFLCALEVKNHATKEIIILQESAVACTKTVPEYLAEPTCK